MLNPLGVADCRLTSQPSLGLGNHLHVLRNEEGRTWPGPALTSPQRNELWTRSLMTKPASSQGEALAAVQRVEISSENQL
jgi:hypothetical protein